MEDIDSTVAGFAAEQLFFSDGVVQVPDLQRIEANLRRVHLSPAFRVDDAMDRALVRLKPHYRAVQALADALLERHSIDGFEAEEILLNHMTQDAADAVRRMENRFRWMDAA